MLPGPSRRAVLSSCGLAAACALAGCLDDAPWAGSSDEPSDGAPSPSGTTEAPTLARSVVSDREARERALAAEEAYLAERLGSATCLGDWGTNATAADEHASVRARTPDAVVVDVSHPYWYDSATVEGDATVAARYRVTAERARRVSGETVAPCRG